MERNKPLGRTEAAQRLHQAESGMAGQRDFPEQLRGPGVHEKRAFQAGGLRRHRRSAPPRQATARSGSKLLLDEGSFEESTSSKPARGYTTRKHATRRRGDHRPRQPSTARGFRLQPGLHGHRRLAGEAHSQKIGKVMDTPCAWARPSSV